MGLFFHPHTLKISTFSIGPLAQSGNFFLKSCSNRRFLTEHAFDVRKDSGVMNETAEATTAPEQEVAQTAETSTSTQENSVISANGEATSSPSAQPTSRAETAKSEDSISSAATPNAAHVSETSPETSLPAVASSSAETAGKPSSEAASAETGTSEDRDNVPAASDSSPAEMAEGAKKTRVPRTPKAPGKPVEAGGSIGTIVERVVRMTTLSDEHAAALGRLFNVSLPEDYVARLTRLTGASLGPIGSGAAEALAIVLGLESANPIHVGVQLGRLAATSLPDVYRCAHALTGETAPALPKGDNAVFAVADVLATLTADDFALARALSSALE
jgi:hypothetical protein